jgi:uncharacterized protein (DUF4415 family)
MKRTSTTKTSAISDDAPKLTQAHFDRAKFRVSGKSATKAEWQEAVRARVAKQRISIMLDAPIIEHFKAIAGDRGYQTLINDALRRAVEGEHLAQSLRAIVREELRAANN